MICRICLQKSRKQLEIFDVNGIQLKIAEIVQKHFWFELLPNDDISKVICKLCWTKIIDFHTFYEQVLDVHKNYFNQLVNLKIETIDEEINDDYEVKIDNMLLEQQNTPTDYKENSFDDDAVYLMEPAVKEELQNDPLNELHLTDENENDATITQTNCKVNTYNDDDDDDNNDKTTKIMSNFNKKKFKIKEKKIKKLKKKSRVIRKIIDKQTKKTSVLDEENTATTLIMEEIETTTPTMEETDTKILTMEETDTKTPTMEEADEENTTPTTTTIVEKSSQKLKQKRNVKPQDVDEETAELIKKYISFGCDLCIFVGENFNDIIKHFAKDHKTVKPFVTCCGRKLRRQFMVKQHAIQHDNPEIFKCFVCSKVFAGSSALRAHDLAHHTPEELLKFECDKCPRKFARRYLLERHISAHSTERRFKCDLCPDNKTYASSYVLSVHISMHHRKSINVCHVCGKNIRDNRRFQKHVESHMGEAGPRVKCPRPNCARWLKDEDNLKVHLRYHNDEGKKFACEKCGKISSSLPALKSHRHYAHSKETFECELCHKTFKKALTLKEHMAGHTGESLYNCPFCERTFNSNANMHSHKKKMHPIEWEKWYKGKYGNLKRGKEASKIRNNNETTQEDDVEMNAEQFIETNENCLVTIELDDE